ncbi:hypothetical protein [Phytopseudomonas dryadis]|uniref:Uncharacterized protein n=1 Tax=Phytopseudomonas dryadis TaxID=2487520 RepID=A0ABY1Z5B8_9GAMM|nr:MULTISPECIES: hypothetical protein [Pseudomonas]TBV05058.1 hypothetical protein DNK34_13480 [Pseudomonas dryadis]TBV16460.1 hypothetical protein DNK41_15335 [Pseudomonas sp. FRB 230]
MANGMGQVARILYKEIVPGDLRKIHAESNDADTGGGARDFRFGSYPSIAAIVMKMFPNQVVETRRRSGVPTPTNIYSGTFYWRDRTGNVLGANSYFEPPTDARPAEGRITRVHEQPCLSTALMPTPTYNNRVFLLLIQLLDDTVWPFYAEEQTLRTAGLWDPQVAQKMLDCIDAQRRVDQAVIGFFDFMSGGSYCNGR